MRPSSVHLRFFVDGDPVTQGSLTPRRVRLRSGRHALRNVHPAGLEPWRARIRIEARKAMAGRRLIDGPVVVVGSFFLVRPPSVNRMWPTSQNDGDGDKMLRALCDALEGTVLTNDARIVGSAPIKAYFDRVGLDGPGVLVEIATLDGRTPWESVARLLS